MPVCPPCGPTPWSWEAPFVNQNDEDSAESYPSSEWMIASPNSRAPVLVMQIVRSYTGNSFFIFRSGIIATRMLSFRIHVKGRKKLYKQSVYLWSLNDTINQLYGTHLIWADSHVRLRRHSLVIWPFLIYSPILHIQGHRKYIQYNLSLHHYQCKLQWVCLGKVTTVTDTITIGFEELVEDVVKNAQLPVFQ